MKDSKTILEVDISISKAWAADAGLKHMHRRPGILLKPKDGVYCSAVFSVLSYGCETRSLRAEGVRRSEIFDS